MASPFHVPTPLHPVLLSVPRGNIAALPDSKFGPCAMTPYRLRFSNLRPPYSVLVPAVAAR